MEAVTITEDAKRALMSLLSDSLQIEYEFIMNYPRCIEILVNKYKITDEQLIGDINICADESRRHFDEISQLIESFGGKPVWKTSVIGHWDDIPSRINEQLEREKEVLAIFKDINRILQQNKVEVKDRKFFGKRFTVRSEPEGSMVTLNEIKSIMDREISDEIKHIRLAENSIATIKVLMSETTGQG